MPKTAESIINDALSMIEVKSAGNDLTDDEMANGITDLNDMMFELDAAGVHLGYSEVSTKTDSTNLDRWALGMVKSRLAIKSAPRYGASPTAALGLQAAEAWKLVLRKIATMGRPNYPDSLPRGAGTTTSGDNLATFFENPTANDILAESGAALTTEINENLQED